jgi:hypothetical protein
MSASSDLVLSSYRACPDAVLDSCHGSTGPHASDCVDQPAGKMSSDGAPLLFFFSYFFLQLLTVLHALSRRHRRRFGHSSAGLNELRCQPG